MRLFPRFFRSDIEQAAQTFAPPREVAVEANPLSLAVRASRETSWRDDGTHMDEFVNMVTRLGQAPANTAAMFVRDRGLCDEELASLYRDSDIAKRIVDARPKAMFRKGYKVALKNQTEGDSVSLDQLKKRAKELAIDKRMAEGIRWGKLYGGAVALLNLDDAGDVAKPLSPDATPKLQSITILDRRFVFPQTWYTDPFKAKFGEVETYMICAQIYTSKDPIKDRIGAIVHESRVVRFDGEETDVEEKRHRMGWTVSCLQAPYDAMKKFASAFDAANIMLSDASTNVFTVKGLMEAIGAGDKDAVTTRLQLLNQGRSVARAMVIDEGETFEKVATNFQDIPDVMDRFMMRLSAAADVPVTLLMGRSPAGENATGEADFRAFYDVIASEQVAILQPILERVYGFLIREIGLADRDFEIEFNPLWEPTMLEWSTIRETQARTDKLYFDMGVLYADEIGISRFGTGTWSPNTEIDVDERRKSLKEEKAMGSPSDVATAKAIAAQPPPPPDGGETDDEGGSAPQAEAA